MLLLDRSIGYLAQLKFIYVLISLSLSHLQNNTS